MRKGVQEGGITNFVSIRFQDNQYGFKIQRVTRK